ncbi:MAG: glycosyltransferase family 2 protein [Deltaproteobacteria bacterium]|nr:glycosyltransferase family 2 protein [Deltaproteobacteria bacterium]
MSVLLTITLAFQYVVLAYFAVLNLAYTLFGYLGLRSIVVYTRELSQMTLRDLLARESYKPVSILVPAYNEEKSIVASVHSFLGLRFPEFEVVVVSDGSTDQTIPKLIEAFALVEIPAVYCRTLPSAAIRRMFRSLEHGNLVVLEKENGGKADALNAAIDVARYPLICSVDADSLLDADALLRATRPFLEDDDVIAIGGTIRPLNGATIVDGRVTALSMPKGWLERLQILEYTRAFFSGRAGWSHFDALLIISGAFGVFRRSAVIEAGGYLVGTVGEDMELVVRLHRRYRELRQRYRILFTPDPICWTEVPADLGTLRRQRNRWHRGLWETLWHHRSLMFNPRFGRLGTAAFPYFLVFEGVSPIVEAIGWVLIPTTFALGIFNGWFAILFLALSVLYGVLLSQLAVGIETLLLQRYPRLRDRLILFAAAFLEFAGYRQILVLERCLATAQVFRKRGVWGHMQRQGIAEEPRDKAAEAAQ